MNTTYPIVADSMWSARQIAEQRARAEGFRHVAIFAVRQLGWRQFEVDAWVSR